MAIKSDPLTPCSGGEYMRRLRDAVAELDSADRALCRAWDERNDARWPRHSTSVKDMAPADDPAVVAAEAKIEDARAAWHAARAKLLQFTAAPLELVCAVSDWRVSPWRMRESCTLPAEHGGKHSFENEDPVEAAARRESEQERSRL